jgi:YD repeat-containing protein
VIRRTLRIQSIQHLVAVPLEGPISLVSDGAQGRPACLVGNVQYDTLGNLTCAVQKGTDTTAFSTCAASPATWRPRSFVYDSLSRLTSATNPESGNITYAYDANGNLSTKVQPKQNKIPADTSSPQTNTASYFYDALNRLTKKSYSDNGATVQYAYDGGSLTGCTYAVPVLSDTNPIGRRTAMCDASGATHWALDITSGTGWKATERRNINNVTNNIVTQNNFGGMVATLTYPSGRIITYAPSGAGRYLSAIDSANSINYAQNATYAPFGGLLTMTNGSQPINVTNAYDKRLQPGTLSASTSLNTIMSLSYDFHLGAGDNGDVFQIRNNRDGNRTQNFTYDALNRIATSATQATSGAACWGENFTIDSWGNLTNRSVSQCVGEALTAPTTNSNQISGYCYDKGGNMLGTNGCPSLPYTPTYFYDAENRLRTFSGINYIYDGDGNRVEKSNGTLYWGSGPLAESDLSGTMLREYIFFNGKRIARRDVSANAVHYYFSDHLGSTSVTTDAVGTMSLCTNSPLGYTNVPTGEDESDFFPYGGERQLCNKTPQNYKFTGKERAEWDDSRYPRQDVCCSSGASIEHSGEEHLAGPLERLRYPSRGLGVGCSNSKWSF